MVPMPCHAVIFISKRAVAEDGYGEALERMKALGTTQPGFLGITSARGADGLGITVVFYDSADAAKAWGRHPEHRNVMQQARELEWYEHYTIYYSEVGSGHAWSSAKG
jgi:heme-degrading monooxygenase HmoA